MLRSALALLRNAPPLERVRAARYRREFERSTDGWPRFCGLFATRAEATAAAPRTRPVGYDHPELASVNVDLMERVWGSDYAPIYWLSRLLTEATALFDLGGHVGTKYYAWRTYLPLREDLEWIVCDLPALVAAGRARATEPGHLRFTVDRAELDGTDILLASGVLQYMEGELETLLSACATPPRHLLIHKLPTREGPDVFTLENLRRSTVPYRIFDLNAFVERLASLGYRAADRWSVEESAVRVPFTSLGEPVHRGLYLTRD